MFDNIAILKKETARTYDAYRNELVEYEDRMVYVYERSVHASEFYSAAQAGLHPSITLQMANRLDYEGESLVEYNGKLYSVIRADWNAQRDSISLVLEERSGQNGTV